MQRTIIPCFLGFLLLTACAPSGGDFSPFTPSPTDQVETEAVPSPETTGSGAVIRDASGATTIAERLLPTGILEIGAHDAPVTMLLVTNFSCRYCRDFDARHLPRLMRDFIRPGTLRYQLLLLPLKRHPESVREASALFCAAAQGKGWPAAEWFFGTTDHTPSAMKGMLKTLKLDASVFQKCIDDPATQEILAAQRSMLDSLAVHLVPTMFINGERSQGVPEYPDLRGRINVLMK